MEDVPVPVVDENSPLVVNTVIESRNSFRDRITSIDVVRGLTIAVMMLVNHSEGGYAALNHSPWNGVRLPDFVMPFFLTIVGMSVLISLEKLKRNGKTKAALTKKVLIRAVKLFVLGLIIQGGSLPYYDLHALRIMGVLQRIAVAYTVVALTVIFIPLRASAAKKNRLDDNAVGRFEAVVVPLWHWLVAVIILGVYCALMYGASVPGCGRGSFADDCNAAGYIDKSLLGESHLYRFPTCRQSNPPCAYFDPEGLVSTLAASLSCFFGLYFGYVLLYYRSVVSRVAQILLPSIIFFAGGVLLDAFGLIHLNKNLYTPSYILYMAGAFGFFFIIFYLLLDVLQTRALLRPFEAMGMNAIACFVGDSVAPLLIRLVYWKERDNTFIPWVFRTFFTDPFSNNVAHLLFALCDVGFWLVVSFLLYWRGVFFKI
eukprot:GCRY01003480.1.p1 GENE.GCRY01003480.1~~GCRY01003480.1.p1  ORF type:complete len:428 (+),score=128.57 GCRY01003480.1:219-1502(+)